MKSFSSPVARSILDELDVGQQPEAGEAVQGFETFFKACRFALIAFLQRGTTSEADAEEIAQGSYSRLLGYGYGGGFWLQGYEDLDLAKRAQYAHSREMKKALSTQPAHSADKANRQTQ